MKFLLFPKVKEKVGLCRSTLWRLEKKGLFPQRRRIGVSRIAWVESEIDEWIKDRPAVKLGGLP